jgi:hypothetical protein
MQRSMQRPLLSLHGYNICLACARQSNHTKPHFPSASTSNGELCNHFWQVTLVLRRSHSGHRQCYFLRPRVCETSLSNKRNSTWASGLKADRGVLRRESRKARWMLGKQLLWLLSFFLFFLSFLSLFHKHNTERLKIFWVRKTAWSKSVRESRRSVTTKPEEITPTEHRHTERNWFPGLGDQNQ